MLHDIRAIAPARTVLDWVLRLGGPRIDPTDVALRILRSLSEQDGATPEAALLQLTRRELLRARRIVRWRGRRGASFPAPDRETDDEMDQLWWRAQLQGVLAALHEEDRVVFVLAELEGRTAEQVAVLLGIRVSSVLVHLHHARRTMEQSLARHRSQLLRGIPAQAWKQHRSHSITPDAEQVRRTIACTPDELEHVMDRVNLPLPQLRRARAAAPIWGLIATALLLCGGLLLHLVAQRGSTSLLTVTGQPALHPRAGIPADPLGVWTLIRGRTCSEFGWRAGAVGEEPVIQSGSDSKKAMITVEEHVVKE